MKLLRLFIATTAAITVCSNGAASGTPSLRLRYDRPAQYFEEALILGNGNLGASVYGGVEHEKISLNDITLWTGEPDTIVAEPDAYKYLPVVREHLAKEDYVGADAANLHIQGNGSEIYMPLGEIAMDFDYQKGSSTTGYQRMLDINTATAEVTYRRGDTDYKRQYFASAPDSVIVVRLSAIGEGKIDGRLRINSELPHASAVCGGALVCDGYAAYHTYTEWEDGKYGIDRFCYDPARGIHYRTAIVPVNLSNEGRVEVYPTGDIKIDGCADVMLIITNVTSFNGNDKDPVKEGRDYARLAMERVKRAADKGYNSLATDHQADYTQLFNRVTLNLGTTAEAISALPTDAQLKSYTDNGDKNPELEVLFFQYGRYLLISSSRTEGVPANLQGLWNERILPPWNSNYTVNINLEENYWPAEVTNLSELHAPLITFIGAMTKTGYDTARHYYGVESGWCAGHNSDIWAITNPIGRHINDPRWANWNMAAAWLTTHIWEHYSFTHDKSALQAAYPALRDAALFCLDWMVEKDGKLITSPSTSPENRFLDNEGRAAATHYGGASDLAMIRECLMDARKAAEVLGVDKAITRRIDNALKKILPYRINANGSLREWYHDFKDEDPQHRHQSHLFGLYPGHHISPEATPMLAEAADKTLAIKGDNTTGWSTGWRVNLYARLGNADRAYFMYRRLLQYVSPDGYNGDDARRGGGTYPNLLGAHSPFQIDSNFGGCAGVAEMLIQSTDAGDITLLAALPERWKDGEVSGLCARGGYIVDMQWKEGKVTSYTLTARNGGQAKVKANGKVRKHKLAAGASITVKL
ncbi:MAG: glycoside hydrolase family 95 protein [Bacteroidales bacterium]|nr:glycoside hydrolase family 95 protein [Bacteroidales bacterium]